ncbi:DUF3817 domain-containing protein [Georgenia wangjunii]|uniref:DUF3817 domain-containing protein n=1 Tax=Georgenia wangjunii TaxID=3117730 RepID=UPI002F25FF1D
MSSRNIPPADEAERKARRTWGFYRVMAFVTGVMLLLLTAEMILVYLVGVGPDVESAIAWIPFVHGWIYVVYVVAVFNLWSAMRWSLGRVAALVAAGVVPVLSFVMERRARAWFEADLPALVERTRARTTLNR